jgi:acetyl-CoA C-acetyltransferase
VVRETLILGGSVTPFCRHRDGSHWRDWVRQAGTDALADAGLVTTDIDAVVVASESDFLSLQINPGPVVLDELGLSGRPVIRVEGGGASGGLALREGMMQIMAGMAKRVLVIGFEAAAGHLDPNNVQLAYSLSFDAEVDGMGGATAVSLYALSIAEHMARFGTTIEQMASVSVKNHGNAVGNPWAHKPMIITIDDVLASPMVATPYHRLDCSLASDGAASIVLAHPDAAPKTTRPISCITGSGVGSDFARLGDRAERYAFIAKRRAAYAAYAMAGVLDAARDIDVAEVCDPFSGTEIQSLEALGLAQPGEAASALADGAFGIESDLPVNLSGGLIGQGGAPGATGIAQAVTMDRLLGGRYRDTVGSFKRGLIDVHGGVGTLAAVHVMERVEP